MSAVSAPFTSLRRPCLWVPIDVEDDAAASDAVASDAAVSDAPVSDAPVSDAPVSDASVSDGAVCELDAGTAGCRPSLIRWVWCELC